MRVRLNVARPRTTNFTARGRDIVAVSNVMEARGHWGRYSSNHSYASDVENGSVTAVTINAQPTIQLPRWARYQQATAEEKREWDRMFAVLTTHENNHHGIFQDKLNRFKRQIERHRRGLSEQQLAQLWSGFDRELQAAQNAYDSRTRNGRSEGVRLDPP